MDRELVHGLLIIAKQQLPIRLETRLAADGTPGRTVPGVTVKGLLPGSSATIISVKHHGSTSAELVYQDAGGRLGSEHVPEETVRTVTENCRTLRFDGFGFEEE